MNLLWAGRLHLLSSSQPADQLLADVEAILTASKSKSAFRKFMNPLSLDSAENIQRLVLILQDMMDRLAR
jgi:hypothetical protein